ncbi:TetR/AcrR family transcriptional regulator [Rhodococcus triatomae]|uniref:TetR/AcrR family transcriptional regulator n=1 Tax=Rhodococcus triatomae TaxID=300028 RepID=UPI0009F4524D|nr:TetR/AcrR family transcriptional regulator [Rhodococcus triatomae]
MTGYAARWATHNVERRTAIVQAAVELLEESPAGTELSVRAVAERAGVAKSVLYRQFGGKDELERRMRSHIVDELGALLTSKLDLSTGSVRSIISRTVQVLADWMIEHPRWDEFLRGGPTFDGDESLDAVSELKLRMARRSEAILASIADALDVDPQAFEPVPYAVVTMVEATMSTWIRQDAPERPRSRIVSDLTDLTVYILDGAARSVGVVADPDEEFTAVLQSVAKSSE